VSAWCPLEGAETLTADCWATAASPPYHRCTVKTARSRVANGKTLINGADKRRAPYREYRDLVSDLADQIGGKPTPIEFAAIEEAAGLIVWCRRARLAMLEGSPPDTYPTGVNTLKRLLDRLGLRGAARARLMMRG
jgi:hypothetical protein